MHVCENIHIYIHICNIVNNGQKIDKLYFCLYSCFDISSQFLVMSCVLMTGTMCLNIKRSPFSGRKHKSWKFSKTSVIDYNLHCAPPPGSCEGALTPGPQNGTTFGDRVIKEAIKVGSRVSADPIGQVSF